MFLKKQLIFLTMFSFAVCMAIDNSKPPEVLENKEVENQKNLEKNKHKKRNRVITAILGSGVCAAALGLGFMGYQYCSNGSTGQPGQGEVGPDKTFNVIFYGDAGKDCVVRVVSQCQDAFIVSVTCVGDSDKTRRVHFLWGDGAEDKTIIRNAREGYFTAEIMEQIALQIPATATKCFFVVAPEFATNKFYEDWGTGASNISYVVNNWLTALNRNMDFFLVQNVENVHQLECCALVNSVNNFNGVFCLFNTSMNFKILGECVHQGLHKSDLALLVNNKKHSTIRLRCNPSFRRNVKDVYGMLRINHERRGSCHFDHFQDQQFSLQRKYEDMILKFYEYGKIRSEKNETFYILETCEFDILGRFVKNPFWCFDDLQEIPAE